MKCTKPPRASHLTGYRTYGCRCDLCRQANREQQKRWRWDTGRTTHRLVKITQKDIERG